MPRTLPALALVCALALLPACSSDDDPGRNRASGGGSASPSASADATSDAFVTRTANFFGPNGKQRTVQLAVHPAVKVPQGLLVPVDLTPEGTDVPAGNDYFCHSAVVCGDFGATSIIDPVGLVRYGPLRDGSADGDVLSSDVPFEMDLGVTYRAGVLFPMPNGDPSTIDLNLQYGGAVTDLPVTDAEPPADLLASPAAEPSEGARVVVLPVKQPTATPYVDRHQLVAKVVGGTLGQGGSTKQGVVSLAADVLFAFDSADLTPRSRAVVSQAAQILAAKADPTQPVAVTGYTDAKGSSSYNASLSQRRAAAVAAALHKNAATAKLTLRVAGRGAEDPVAPNERPDGSDDPAGRALNRRVELAYTPKAPPSPSPQPPAASPAGATDGPALATVSAPNVIGSGAGGVPMSAAVRSVRREGLLTLVEVTVTPGRDADSVDYFSRYRVRHDVGAWRLVVPSTGAVHVAANDVDDEHNVLGTYVKQMNGGRDYLLSVWTAVLPPDVTKVDVDLGQLGVAKGVPVS